MIVLPTRERMSTTVLRPIHHKFRHKRAHAPEWLIMFILYLWWSQMDGGPHNKCCSCLFESHAWQGRLLRSIQVLSSFHRLNNHWHRFGKNCKKGMMYVESWRTIFVFHLPSSHTSHWRLGCYLLAVLLFSLCYVRGTRASAWSSLSQS